jgi:nucleotide-binding universal stress UspA family protein
MGVIVVGIDHSAGAKSALRFAAAEAQLRQATLRPVHAWQFAHVAPGIEAAYSGLDANLEELRHAAEAVLEATVRETIPDEGALSVELRVVEGLPASVLVDESRHAELLVVGSRGLGGFRGLLLGSVSQQCAQHAVCPVVIVRAPSETSR